MKREVSIGIFAVLIVVAAILTVYYLNVGPTGFAIYNHQTSDLSSGTYDNTSYDGSSVVLNSSSNATTGSYISGILDSAGEATWNNLTWQGDGVQFEVRVCTASDCNGTSFSSANLTNLNLTGRYFQYRAAFDSVNDTLNNVAVDYSLPEPATAPVVSVSAPAGEDYTSLSDIPLTFTISQTGTNLTCLYNINYAGGELVANTTVSCVNGSNSISFDIPKEGGDNILTLYITDSVGTTTANSPVFQISAPSETTTSEEPTTEQPPLETPLPEATPVTQITLGAIASQDMIQGDSKTLSLSVQNTGTVPVSSCALSGDDSGWITIVGSPSNIEPGASASFSFSVDVPEDTSVGAYTRALSIACAETSGSTSLAINVLQKKIDFNITDVQRTRDDRVRVDYTITELAGEDQDLQIYFSIKDASGAEIANASQNRSVDANKTDDFRTNIAINETVNGTMTLSAAFNSQIYSSTVLEPITLGAPTGAAIFAGVGGGSVVLLVIVVLVLAAIFFVARKLRKSGRLFGGSQ